MNKIVLWPPGRSTTLLSRRTSTMSMKSSTAWLEHKWWSWDTNSTWGLVLFTFENRALLCTIRLSSRFLSTLCGMWLAVFILFMCGFCVFLWLFFFFFDGQVSGAAPPKPCTSFAHFGFDEQLMNQIRKSEYTQPTPIQCQVTREIIGNGCNSYSSFFFTSTKFFRPI